MICQHCDAMREVKVKGMCMACYMRARRSASGSGQGRRKNGESLRVLLSMPDRPWLHKLHGNIEASADGGCHVWQGSTNKGGYGVIHVAGFTVLAHRVMHALSTGDTSTEVVMHTCDNPRCCNPQHLRSGTYQDNVDDMHNKGRHRSGNCGHHLKDRASHPRSKPVVTPGGEYPSAKLAAEALGISYAVVKRKLRNGVDGYRYL